MTRGLRVETATNSLGKVLGVSSCVTGDDLYTAMDWVLERKEPIESSSSVRHLSNGMLVLYGVSLCSA